MKKIPAPSFCPKRQYHVNDIMVECESIRDMR